MTNRPDPAWYTLNADASAPTRLLDDDGHPKLNLSTDAEHALAALAAAVHAVAWRLGERELRHLEGFIGISAGVAETTARAGAGSRRRRTTGRPRRRVD